MEDPGGSGSSGQIDSAPTKQDGKENHAPSKLSDSEKLSDFDPMEQDHEPSQPRCSNCEKVPHRRFEIEGEAFMIAHDEKEPKTIQEALSSSTSKEWNKEMEDEMNSRKSNQVWDLVNLLPGRKTIGNKWVLNIKRKEDRTIDRYKARLVAKGYTQQKGINYEETLHVIMFASTHLILAIVAQMDLELYQMEVKNDFLNR